ncbi:MAG: beta-propeller domain-containing protein [Deltaproteobacteria bacterium]|nr:beta-propeller domain-containing protein [Deltaproteobacteria bacterium]
MERTKKWRVIIAISLAACGSEQIDTPKGGTPLPSLDPAGLALQKSDGATLLAAIQATALEEVDALECYDVKVMYDDMPTVGAPVATATDSGEGTSAVPLINTDTNNQEANVEEGDQFKVRNDLAFSLSHKASGLHILRIWPASQFHKIGFLPLDIDAWGDAMMVVTDGRVVVIGERWINNQVVSTIHLINVKDPTKPVLMDTVTYEGLMPQALRRIDGRVVAVLTGNLKIAPTVGFKPYTDDCEKTLDTKRAQLRETVNAHGLTDWLPKRVVDGDVYLNELRGSKVLSVVTFAIDAAKIGDHISSVVGDSTITYMSPTGVFAAQNVPASHMETDIESTAIHHFDIAGTAAEYRGTGVVNGWLLNQFAMSEFDGTLRVATTIGHVGKTDDLSTNTVYTFDTTTTNLPLIGALEGLAQGEQIYAVRFIREMGYVVTFKKVDPLFVIDLHDPAHPAVTGELKVPGYSTYLHPLGTDQLIGLGKDAEDMGEFAWYQGLKLSIFDVRQDIAPSEMASLIIGGRGSDSPALYDHHAFTFDAVRNLLALPLSLYEKNAAGGSAYGKFLYNGLHLYKVSAGTGFTLVGTIQEVNGVYGDLIERTAIVGTADNAAVIAVGADQIELYSIGDTLTLVGVVTLEPAPVKAVAVDAMTL